MPINPRSRNVGSYRPHRENPEAGVTLVELLVTMALLAIILTALAGTLVVTLRAVTHSEQEVIATQLASEVAETVYIGDFEFAALYEDEIDPASNPLATDWEARVDTSTGEFEGAEIVTVPGPPVGGRDARYPEPVVLETREGIDFRLDRYITWIDRDGDGTVETKRLSTFVTWTNNTGESRELRFDSERVPTQQEAAATDAGTRVIQFTFTPDPVQLNDGTGEQTQSVDVEVRTNEDTFNGSLQFYTYDSTNEAFVLQTVPMTIGELGVNGGYVTWTATLSGYVFDNGTIDVLFQADDVDAATVESLGTLEAQGGPYSFVNTPTPDGTNSGESVTPSTDPDPSESPSPGAGVPVAITVQERPSEICINTSTGELSKDLYVLVLVDGLTQEDGKVTMTYPYYTSKGGGSPDAIANDTLEFVQELTDASTYDTTIKAGSKIFKKGSTVTFDLAAERNGGNFDVDTDTESFTLTVNSC